ncbi:MAG: divergent polysaccharide deacetylase family protein [Bdellovibrionales bacterium]
MNFPIRKAPPLSSIVFGVGLTALVYSLFLVMSLLKGPSTINSIESRMTVQNIVFERMLNGNNKETPFENVELTGAEVKNKPLDTIDKTDIPDTPSPNSAVSLSPAPFEGLTEPGSFGDLPVIGKNNLKPFDAYKKPYVIDVQKRQIALIVRGLGLSPSMLEQSMKIIPTQMSVLLSPYADDVDLVHKKIRSRGYETWLNLPLENKRFPNVAPGSLGILADAGLRFNQDNLRRTLSLTQGYAGIASYSDAAFINSDAMLSGLFSDVMQRGLGFFEMNTGRDAMSLKVAVNNRSHHVSVSNRIREQRIEKVFEALKKKAVTQKQAIGVVDVSPIMLETIQAEIIKAQNEGYEFVPLSALTVSF